MDTCTSTKWKGFTVTEIFTTANRFCTYLEEFVQIHISTSNDGSFVYWCTPIIHELVQLSYKVVFFFPWLIIRTLKN
jgi:hypothetical protein